ncbi:hypothetical protein DFA_02811 [Cavenderia fasciculata]|uniref:Uncharacterized protein n=1 Tax=Cavenderia fasciculata TaxID=261658 RepID=F4PID4_CACFS|nr:uncharacterized protein DFA_02811 [Cavenderia fasciculata]EGG24568.1 hypothetical protein DFA_02811 [Cavenderia fasciculata]|eukprot:XP_004362419.1 hypothetical protein DFA_02811 [Cavenderia fasciculata]
MIIDKDKIIPSKVTILPNNDPLFSSQQMVNQGYNLLTVFDIPQFKQSVELDPSFNAIMVGDDVNSWPDDSECDTEQEFSLWKVIIIVLCATCVLVSIILIVIGVMKQEKLKKEHNLRMVRILNMNQAEQNNNEQNIRNK